MIDKITPHPDNRIADKLAADGLENAKPFVTEKGTHAAVYVNSESPALPAHRERIPERSSGSRAVRRYHHPPRHR